MKATLIPVNVLKAMSLLASKKDVRYYLNGVLVESNSQHTRIVATDGHILGVYQTTETAHNDEAFSIIIPNEIIAKLDKKDNFLSTNEQDNWVIDGIAFTPVDGKFPDYNRVLPRTDMTNEVAQFNPDFIARFQKVGKLLANNAVPTIAHNGIGSALVDIGLPNFVGVMMPIRTEKPLSKTPLVFLNSVSV
jgi:DNA polymerase-3 subunit beta